MLPSKLNVKSKKKKHKNKNKKRFSVKVNTKKDFKKMSLFKKLCM